MVSWIVVVDDDVVFKIKSIFDFSAEQRCDFNTSKTVQSQDIHRKVFKIKFKSARKQTAK